MCAGFNEKEPHALAPELAHVTVQSTPFGGFNGSFATTAAMLAFASVTIVVGGAFEPVAKLIVIAVDAVIGIVTVDDEFGLAFDVAVIVTLPAGLTLGAA